MQEKFERFIEKHWRAVVIGVALIYIGLGLYQILTGIDLDETKTRGFESFLMVIAIAAFFYGKRKEKERMEKESKEQEGNQATVVENISDETNKGD